MKDANTQELHETNRYSDDAFPVGIYVVTREGIIPDGRGFQDLHWHEELQFTLVISGILKMRVNRSDYVLERGQAIFINKNLLHITTELSDDGKYISLNFLDWLLDFFQAAAWSNAMCCHIREIMPFPWSCSKMA